MRVVQPLQMQLGEQAIAAIRIDTRSRDDIPKILQGLQHLYTRPALRNAVFDLLRTHIKADKEADNGRPAMDLWKLFVMGILRLDLNWNYDRLHEQVNHHKTRFCRKHLQSLNKPFGRHSYAANAINC